MTLLNRSTESRDDVLPRVAEAVAAPGMPAAQTVPNVLSASSGRRLRVLQIINSLHFGGAENVLVKLALGVDDARFETEVCCISSLGAMSEPLIADGIAVRRAGPRGRVHNFLRPWYVQRIMSAFRPDVVHTHGLPPLVDVGQLALLRSAPRWVHTYHFGNYPHMKKRYLLAERLFSSAPDQLVAVSDRQREAIIHFQRVDPARIITVPNGVQPNPFVGDGVTRDRKRAELGISKDAFVVGSVAVLIEQKGITYLLQAAQELRHQIPQLKVLVVGGGPLEQKFREEAAARDLSSVVLFTGWRADVPELLSALDVWVMASIWEAMPVALLEAMSARLPIVVTDVGQNKSIVQDNVGGLVIPARDHSAIAGAVAQVHADPARARQLGDAAFRRVQDQYSTLRMIERYQELYAPRPNGKR